jgi:hypothetical protein
MASKRARRKEASASRPLDLSAARIGIANSKTRSEKKTERVARQSQLIKCRKLLFPLTISGKRIQRSGNVILTLLKAILSATVGR